MTSANTQSETSYLTPIIASQLLTAQQAVRDKHASCGRDALLTTGCAEIDEEVMGGGWKRGQILGLSGEMAVARLISLKLVADALVKSQERVVVIDTAGSFPVRVLAGILGRLMGKSSEDVDAEVRRCLERVDICRALDFLGIVEIMEDMKRMCEEAEVKRDQEVGIEVVFTATEGVGVEIEDSEAENESSEDLVVSPEITGRPGSGSKSEEKGTSVILIDNITSVVGNLFNSSELTSSHNLLQVFTTNLLSMTRRHNILTLILNSTLNTPPPAYQARQASAYTSHGNQSVSPSIFASNSYLRPSLGALFSNVPELHLMLSRLPTGRQDAELLYGDGELGEQTQRDVTGVHFSYILEVIKDEQGVSVEGRDGSKWESREQRWGAFDVVDTMDLKDAVVKSGYMADTR